MAMPACNHFIRGFHWPVCSGTIYLLGLILYLMPVVAQETAPNPVEVFPPIYHMGAIPDSRPAYCFFTLINNSGAVARILRTSVPCSCTILKVPGQLISKEQAQVQITFDPRGRHGYSRWEVMVYTSLMQAPLPLSFDVTVLQDGFLSAQTIHFGEFRRGTAMEKQMWVSPPRHPDFKIIDTRIVPEEYKDSFIIHYEAGLCSLFYPKPRPGYLVRIAAAQNHIPFGRLEAKLVLHTDIPKQETIEIPVLAVVTGEIGLSRDYLALGVVKTGTPVIKKFMVYHRDGQPLQIHQVHSELPFIQATVETIIPEQYFEIVVKCHIQEKVASGEFRGKLMLKTSSTEQPQVIIPIQGIVLPPSGTGSEKN